MSNLMHYIKSTFNYRINIDSKQFLDTPRLRLLEKREYKIYMVPITYPDFKDKQDKYNQLAMKAFQAWSDAIYNEITFKQVYTQYEADMKVYFLTTSITKVGKQYQEEIATLVPEYNLQGKLCIAIGIRNVKNEALNDKDIYHILLHEIGHLFGLGHSPDPDDIMYGGGHWNTEFSMNDLFVLRLIYTIGNNKSFKESEKIINKYIAKFTNSLSKELQETKKEEKNNQIQKLPEKRNNTKINSEQKNIMEDLDTISDLKKYNLTLQNIQINISK